MLTVTVQFAISFSSFLVENKNLVTFYQTGNNFANYLCAFYSRSTYSDVAVFVYQKNFLEFYCCTGFSVLHVVYKQFLASFCFELLAVDFYNCVHFLYIMYKLAPSGGL